MRSYGGLWRQIVDAENLRAAWCRVRRHHANSDECRAFEAQLDENLSVLKDELESGCYQPSAYRQFKIWDPKPRIISCAPVRDRVVHHALCDVISPLLERSFIETSFACRVGKGSHTACAKTQELARQHAYCLKLDIHHYFDSIKHAVLLPVVQKQFRERPVKDLIEKIVKTYATKPGKGLPIGNLTSQWFANVFLNEFDHLAVVGFKPCRSVENVECVGYIRYMDDMLFFCDAKAEAWRIYDAAKVWLKSERDLELKEEATRVAPVSEGVPFLGLNIYPRCWRLRHGRFWRTRRKFRLREREFLEDALPVERLEASVRSIDGGARWFGFRNILRTQNDNLILATEERAASGSNRVNRGGSWNNGAGNCTSSYRNNNNPSNTNNNLGFRLFSTRNGSMSNSVQPAPETFGTNNAETTPAGKRSNSPTAGVRHLILQEDVL